ncbi:MAG TPA: DUF6458 family protein [Actinomycetota bacterium]|jgi:hypothetical protein|nr:DUF6458 family protein [Actinomycetota bacterium]
MSLGVSIFLLVVGAILAFAVRVHSAGLDLNVVGVILMGAGAFILSLYLIFWASFSPWARRRRPLIESVYDDTAEIEIVEAPPVVRRVS